METIVIKFTNFRLHLCSKLAPCGHYILVYDTCSTHWIFLSLAEGQMWHLSGFTGRITSGFPLSGTGFCRMETIKIRSSLVIFSHAKQRFISTITRSKPRSNKKEKRFMFVLMFLRILYNICVHLGDIKHKHKRQPWASDVFGEFLNNWNIYDTKYRHQI